MAEPARRWRMTTTTPAALLGLRISGRRLGSLSLSRAVHPSPGGTCGPTGMPASTLTCGSKGRCRGAPPLQSLGLASPPAGGEGGQEIRWPAASTRRAGLGVRPRRPSPPLGAATPAADGSSSARGRAAPRRRPRRALVVARGAPARPASAPMAARCRTTQLGRALPAEAFLDERIQATGRLGGAGGGGGGGRAQRYQTHGRPAQAESPRRRGSVAWRVILRRHASGRQTPLFHLLAHMRADKEPRPRAFSTQKTSRSDRRRGRAATAPPPPWGRVARTCALGQALPLRLASTRARGAVAD